MREWGHTEQINYTGAARARATRASEAARASEASQVREHAAPAAQGWSGSAGGASRSATPSAQPTAVGLRSTRRDEPGCSAAAASEELACMFMWARLGCLWHSWQPP